MAKKNERTLRMIENYWEHHLNGWSNTKIADYYQISYFTLYNHLQEIADMHGVTRDELLFIHLPPRVETLYSGKTERTELDDIKQELDEMENCTKAFLSEAKQSLQERGLITD